MTNKDYWDKMFDILYHPPEEKEAVMTAKPVLKQDVVDIPPIDGDEFLELLK